MRKANGYGSVVKLGGRRRKPYAARITTGFEINLNEDGNVKSTQKYHYIGTYPTQRDAELALAIYNNDPYDPLWASLTFAECYQKALEAKDGLAQSTLNGHRTAYNKSGKLYNKRIVNIKTKDLQSIVNTADSISKQQQLLKMFNLVFDYAVKDLGVIRSSCVKQVKITAVEAEKEESKPYQKEELQHMWDLWKNGNQDFVSVALCQTYTGTRIMEILKLKKEHVHLDERWIQINGTKSENADRKVPLHKDIIPILQHHLEDSNNTSEYVFINPESGKVFTNQRQYMVFYNRLRKKIFSEDHTPHDARRTFISTADTAGINENALKKIVGHALQGVTGKVYTYKTVEELIAEVDKLTFL